MSEYDSDRVLPDAARYVQPQVNEARLQRVWAGVDARLPRRGRSRLWGWALGLGAAAVAATALVVIVPRFDHPEPQSLLAGAVLETASDSLTMGLVDGSSLKLEQRSRVEVASSGPAGVRLRLKRGRIECSVQPRKEPNFVVLADGVEVRVVGTRFAVATERDSQSRRVEVQVHEGVVEVKSSAEPGEVVRLKAGQSWSQVTKTGPSEKVAAKPVPAVSAEPVAPQAPSDNGIERAASGPRELLEEANALRRAGKAREAAKRYEALLTRYGSDSRAGLAAFELGRLRMDRFGDMKGAIVAFEKAMALAPGSGFREDALARVVTAHARSGNQAGCKQAKQRYLASYPRGIHRQAVLDQCGAP